MTSRVTVTSTSLRYRGILRTQQVLLANVVGLGVSESSPTMIFGDVPALIWRCDDRALRQTDLFCLASTPGKFGSSTVSTTTVDLHATLEPYLPRNL